MWQLDIYCTNELKEGLWCFSKMSISWGFPFIISLLSPYQRSSKPCPPTGWTSRTRRLSEPLPVPYSKRTSAWPSRSPLNGSSPLSRSALITSTGWRTWLGARGTHGEASTLVCKLILAGIILLKLHAVLGAGGARFGSAALCFTHTHAGGLLRQCFGSHTPSISLDLSTLSRSTNVMRIHSKLGEPFLEYRWIFVLSVSKETLKYFSNRLCLP